MSAARDVGGIATLSDFFTIIPDAFPNMANLVSSVGNLFAAFKNGQGVISGLQGVFSGLWGVIAAHPFIALAAGIAAAYLAFNSFNKAGEKAEENMNTAFDSFEESKSKVEEISSELESIQGKMDAIKLKGSLSFVDAAELSNLEKANELLTTQYDLAQKEEARNAEKAIDSAQDAFNKNYRDINSFLMTGGELSKQSVYDAAVENQFLTEYDEHNQENLVNAVAAYMAAQENNDQEAMNSISKMAFEQLQNVNDYRDKLSSIDDSLLDAKSRTKRDTLLNTLDTLSDLVYETMDPDQYQVNKFGELFNNPKYTPTIEGLKTLAKNAKGIGITADEISELAPVLAQAFEDGGFAVQDIADAVNSEVGIFNSEEAANQAIRNYYKNKRASDQDITYDAEEGVQNALDQIKEMDEQIEEEAGEDSLEVDKDVDVNLTIDENGEAPESFGEFFRGLTEDAQKIVLNMQSEGFDFSSIDPSQWASEVNGYIQSSEDASETTLDLAGDLTDLQHVFSDTGGLTKAITDYKTQMNSLTTARDKWNKGELTTSDMLDLQQQFYDLNAFDMTNFGDGVQQTMENITGSFEYAKTGYSDFRDQLIKKDPSLEKAFNRLDNFNRLKKAYNGAGNKESYEDATDILEAAQKYGLVEEANIDSVEGFVKSLGKQSTTLKKSTGIVGKFEDAIQKVGGAETVAGRALVRMRDNLLGLYNVAGDATTAYDSLKEHIGTFTDYQTVANNALKSSRSATGLTTEEIEKLSAAYRDVKGFDPAKLFEQTANGVHLNTQEFKRLNDEVKQNTLKDMYTDLIAKQEQLENVRKAGGDTSALEADIQNAQLIISQYEGLTSAYNAWLTAKSNGNERDSYESLGKSAYDDMKKIMDAGWKGDESLNSYLDLMLSASQRTNDVYADWDKLSQKIEGTSHSLMDYWQYDSDNNLVVDGLADFLKDVNSVMGDDYVNIGEDDAFGIDFTGEKLQEVADRFGMSTELLELFGRAMIDAGMDVDFTDQKLVDTSNTLKELQDQGIISPEIDTEGITNANETLEEAHSSLDSLTEEKKKLEVEAEVNSDAIDALDVAIDAESAKVVSMEIQAELAGGASIEDMIGWSDEKLMAELDIDASQVDEARAQLQELSGQTETTTITVEIEESQFDALTSKEGTVKLTPEVEEIPEQTGNVKLTPEVEDVPDQDVNANVHVGVVDPIPDQDATVNYHTGHVDPIPDQTATVKYSNKGNKVSNQTANINYNTGNVAPVPDQTAIVNYTTGSIDSIPDQTANVNYTANLPEDVVFEDKEATATYHVVKEPEPEYPDQSPSVNYGINAPAAPVYASQYPTVSYRMIAPSPPSYSNISRTVTYTIRTVGSAPSGTKHAEGTMTSLAKARSNGSMYNVINYKNAYADGKVALDADEIALVNELGTESIIRNGKWMLLPPGMHQQHLKKGDIILSAKQTQALLDTGAALGHGRAYAYGTLSNAYYTGSGTIGRPNNTPTYSAAGTSSSSSGGSSSGGYSGGGSSGGTTSGGTTTSSATDNNEKDEPDYFDWIELKLDRIQRKIADLKKLADQTFRSWSNRSKSLQQEIEGVTTEIDLQKQAYHRYLKEADSIQLSGDLKKLVQEGNIDISLYDSDTQDLIKKYQEFYEKALDCKDAVRDLQDTLKELFQQQFDNIITRWENSLQNLQHTAERTESTISARSNYASDYVTSFWGRNASEMNIKSYRSLISNAKAQRTKRQKELNELNNKLNEGLKNGTIQNQSEAHHEMLKEIQDVENEIDSLNESIVDYSNNISAEYVKMFDSIAQDYENRLSMAQHYQNEYETYLEYAQARGYATSTIYYQNLVKSARQKLNLALQSSRDLQASLDRALRSGEIKKGSQAWYDMRARIDEANEAVAQGRLEVQEYNNQIRQIKWDKFDYLQEKIENVATEGKFLIDLFDNSDLFDDKGVATSEGNAVMALHGMSYDVYRQEAKKYGEQISALNKQIAKDESNVDLIKRRDELIDKQQQSIKNAESEKTAIKNLVNEGIKQQLSYMKNLISEYKSALDASKDLYDYQKKISDKTSEISKLEKQLSAYSNDVSEETRAKIQQIQVELKEKKEELEETEYEHMISDTKKMLDGFYDDYQEALNKRLDDVDQLLRNVVDATNKNSSDVSETIRKTATDAGYTLTEEMKKIFDPSSSKKILSGLDQKFTTVSASITSIVNTVNKIWEVADKEATSIQAYINNEKTTRDNKDTQNSQNSNGTKQDAKTASATTTTTKKTSTTTTKKPTTTTKKPTTTTKKTSTTTTKKPTTTTKKPTLTDEIKKHVAAAIWSGRYGWEVDPVRAQRLAEVFGENNGIQSIVSMGYNYSASYSPEGYSYLEMRKKFKGYESGSKHVGKNQLAWTNENWDSVGSEIILRASDRAVLTPLASDDRIYNAMASSRLWDAANNPSHYIAQNMHGIGFGSSNSSQMNISQHFDNITFEFPNVKNYDELIREMQQDNKFEKLIQSMTLGRVNGKSQSHKYHINIGN